MNKFHDNVEGCNGVASMISGRLTAEEPRGMRPYAASHIVQILHSTSGPWAQSIDAIPWAVASIVTSAAGTSICS
uniref:Uncharacterized protein n=1 Tax=Rhizophora mucronata TaxID=61149 RepID=A0A2P2MUF3_RHIMU